LNKSVSSARPNDPYWHGAPALMSATDPEWDRWSFRSYRRRRRLARAWREYPYRPLRPERTAGPRAALRTG